MFIYKDEEVRQLNSTAESSRRKLGDNPVNLKRHFWGFSIQERQHNVNADALYNKLDQLGLVTRRASDGSYYVSQEAFTEQLEAE